MTQTAEEFLEAITSELSIEIEYPTDKGTTIKVICDGDKSLPLRRSIVAHVAKRVAKYMQDAETPEYKNDCTNCKYAIAQCIIQAAEKLEQVK